MRDQDNLKMMATIGYLFEKKVKDQLKEAKALGFSKEVNETTIQVEASLICIRKALNSLEKIPNSCSLNIFSELRAREIGLGIYLRIMKEV